MNADQQNLAFAETPAQRSFPAATCSRSLRVLVACEYSGTVRDAFAALGHDAMSCDLLPTDEFGPHIGRTFFVLSNASAQGITTCEKSKQPTAQES